MDKRTAALMVWDNLYGLPYRWGGDNPIAGFDCSGFILEGLKSVGLVDETADFSAHNLRWDLFKNKIERVPKPGCLLFFEKNNKIFHVEAVWQVIDGLVLTIGASGGGSETTTPAAAEASDAYIKIRPRKTWSYCIDPFE
jgi:hypothetical protein